MTAITRKGNRKQVNPVSIDLNKMDLYEGRKVIRVKGIAPMEETLKIYEAVDPDLKKIAEHFRKIYCPEDDI